MTQIEVGGTGNRDLSVPAKSIRAVESDPSAIVIAHYQTEQNFALAFREAEGLEDPMEKARSYFFIAQSLLWAGKNPDVVLELTRLNLLEERQKRAREYKSYSPDSDFGLDRMEEVTYELVRLANIIFTRGGNPTQVIEEAHQNIRDYSRGIEVAPERGGTGRQLQVFLDMKQAQVAGLSLLSEFILANPELPAIDLGSLVNEMGAIVSGDAFQKHSSSAARAKAFVELARVQIYTGDLAGAQVTIDKMRLLKTVEHDGVQSDNEVGLVSHKVRGFVLLGAVQARVSREFPVEGLTQGQKNQILRSDNAQAIIALGFNIKPEEAEELMASGTLNPETEKNLLIGMEEKLKQEEQTGRDRRSLIEAKRRELEQK